MPAKKITIENLFLSGERFAAISVHFPVAGFCEAEGRIRRVPSSNGGCDYWVDRLCMPAITVLQSEGCERSTWDVYFHGEGA